MTSRRGRAVQGRENRTTVCLPADGALLDVPAVRHFPV